MNQNTLPENVAAEAATDARLQHLHGALCRTRAVLAVAMLDGSIRYPLWANEDESLLDYLDLAILSAS